MNPASIESHVRLVLSQWMVIIAVAWLFGRLARRVGQPLAVGEIMAGILLGPSAFGALFPEAFKFLFPPATTQTMLFIGKMGLILLLFQVGMEFDFSHLLNRTRKVSLVALMGLIAPAICGWMIGPWLHTTFAPHVPYFGFQLFVCVAMAITALPIMGRILLELKLERTPLGVLAISAAALDDVVGWIMLAVVTALATSGFQWKPVLIQVGGLAVLCGLMFYVVGPLLRKLWRKLATQNNALPASFLVVLLIALFSSCLATNILGVFSIFGAFLLGVALHQEIELVRVWRERFSEVVLIALVPIFFTNTGLRTEIGSLSSGVAWLGCLAVIGAAIVGKLGGCYAGARLSGTPASEAACIAALMNTRALMGLIAINVGADLGLLPRELFTMFVIMALVTTAMTGPLLKIWLPPAQASLDGVHCSLPEKSTS
jgi:Kef-type K+ transport system membrane component KefB